MKYCKNLKSKIKNLIELIDFLKNFHQKCKTKIIKKMIRKCIKHIKRKLSKYKIEYQKKCTPQQQLQPIPKNTNKKQNRKEGLTNDYNYTINL